MKALKLLEAISLMQTHTNARLRTHECHIFELSGKVLAHDLYCQKPLPSFDNSAMDGYAIKLADLGKKTQIIGRILAGDQCEENLKEGSCFKVMTGAPLPIGSEAVVPFECATEIGDCALLPQDIKRGANIKILGEELSLGAPLLRAGELLDSSHVALLASQGFSVIPVYAPLRIGVYSSGNELIEPWLRAKPHQIYNSNASMLFSMLRQFGFSPEYLGVLPDSLNELRAATSKFSMYDAIFTTGGVSKGEADFMEKALSEAGMEVLFHGVDIKPGKPMMLGRLGETTILNLPGNPLAATVNMHYFGIPMLRKLQGVRECHLNFSYAINGAPLKLKGGRINLVLGELRDGRFFATDNGKYGSGMLTPLTKSNALIICDHDLELLEIGALVKIIPYNMTLSTNRCNFINTKEQR